MFESLKERYRKLIEAGGKNPVSEIFKNPDYVQGTEERHTQLLFLKLLMIAAHADGSVSEDEINLIKDYAFAQCLNEQEWTEIDFFRHTKPSEEDIRKIYDEIEKEISSAAQRRELIGAIREIINADGLVSDDEKNIIEMLENRDKNTGGFLAKNIIGKIKAVYGKMSDTTANRADSYEYSLNPILPVLKSSGCLQNSVNASIAAAKLGLAVVLINADMEFHENEKEAFIEMIEKECCVDRISAEKIAAEIMKIPDTVFEISHLARIITESLSEDDRKKFLCSLFKIARADRKYDAYEDKYLRVISRSLLLTHCDFIAVKNRK